MRIVFVMRSVALFPYQSGVIQRLCAGGHHVEMLFDKDWSRNRPCESLDRCVEETPGLSRGQSMRRRGFLRRPLFAARELSSYISYVRRDGQSVYYRRRWEGYLPRPIQALARRRFGRALLAGRACRSVLQTFERFTAPDRAILRQMEEERPDVVVSPSVNLRFSEETDYFKAARHLGIPTVFCVLSWDNLTTKGVIPMAPDLTVVWNEAQKKEAVRIHGVPSGKILVAGSPFFEKWFGWGEEEPDRTAFCDKVGLAPDVPFVLYLGSSKNVAQDETWLVRKLAKRLRESPHAVLRTARILARPHPANARVFQSLVNGDNGICVWPRRPFAFEKGVPDSPATIRDFYCSLRLCIAAVGINTSGMLDAVVLDCPTIAVLTDRYRATQEATNHFQHLVGANAIATARGVDDCLRQLAEMADGQDSRRPQRMQFVSDFVRPLGPERSAAEVAAMGIILVAQGMPPEDIGKLLTQAGAVGSRQPPCSRTVEPSTG